MSQISIPNTIDAEQQDTQKQKRIESFANFLLEINDHFNYVLGKLKWKAENIRINWGAHNVVLAFFYNDKEYIFRVPKIGSIQIRNQRIAYTLFEEYDFIPKMIYFDHKCIIEEFVNGVNLQSAKSDHYQKLAKALGVIHSHPTQGYGTLVNFTTGDLNDFEEYLGEKLNERLDKAFSQNIIPYKEEPFREKCDNYIKEMGQLPTCINHGDIWMDNIKCNAEKTVLLDWEFISSTTIYRDLIVIEHDWVDSHNKKIFLDEYESYTGTKVEKRYINFMRFVKEVRHPKGMSKTKVAKISKKFFED